MFSSIQFFRKPRTESFTFPVASFTISMGLLAFLLGWFSGAHWNIHAIMASFTF